MAAVYLANESADYHSLQMFDDISDDLVSLKATYNLPFVFMGDFNSRTGRLTDFYQGDELFERLVGIDKLNERVNEASMARLGIRTQRANCDRQTNNNGRSLVEMCKEHGLLICNGRVGSDSGVGQLTCHNRNGGTSAVDIALASPDLFPLISEFKILEFSNLLWVPIVL